MVFSFCQSVCAERKQSDGSCSLNCQIDLTLMLCACTGYTAGKNLASFRYETAKRCNILVINGIDMIYAALADLSLRSSYSISFNHVSLSSKINALLRTECPHPLRTGRTDRNRRTYSDHYWYYSLHRLGSAGYSRPG